jgi:hypothetical protein
LSVKKIQHKRNNKVTEIIMNEVYRLAEEKQEGALAEAYINLHYVISLFDSAWAKRHPLEPEILGYKGLPVGVLEDVKRVQENKKRRNFVGVLKRQRNRKRNSVKA